MKSSNNLVMKVNGFFVSKVKGILFAHLWNPNTVQKESFLTSNPEDARNFNWFTFGFFEYIFREFGFIVKESYVLKVR